mgnify:CR=1 FL=1
MKSVSIAFLNEMEKHGDLRRAVVIFALSNANGVRYLSRRRIPEEMLAASGYVALADGTYAADGSILAGAGAEENLGSHDWVLDGGSYQEGRFLGLNPLDLFQRNELSTLALALSNEPDGDGHPRMTRILATEPILNARLDVRAGFEGHTLADVLLLKSFRVRRAVEEKGAVTLECEGA